MSLLISDVLFAMGVSLVAISMVWCLSDSFLKVKYCFSRSSSERGSEETVLFPDFMAKANYNCKLTVALFS